MRSGPLPVRSTNLLPGSPASAVPKEHQKRPTLPFHRQRLRRGPPARESTGHVPGDQTRLALTSEATPSLSIRSTMHRRHLGSGP